MARKKKSTVVDQPIPEERTPVQTSSGIGYQGTVRIQFMKGNRIYKTIEQHNEGTAELFRYLARALAGNTDSSNMPRYLHTFQASDPSLDQGDDLWGTEHSTCALNVPFSNVEVRYNSTLDGYNTEYTFMVPYSQIWGTTNVLALYNTTSFGNSVVPLAFIRLVNSADQIEVSSSNTSNIVITWIMTVYNAPAAVE